MDLNPVPLDRMLQVNAVGIRHGKLTTTHAHDRYVHHTSTTDPFHGKQTSARTPLACYPPTHPPSLKILDTHFLE